MFVVAAAGGYFAWQSVRSAELRATGLKLAELGRDLESCAKGSPQCHQPIANLALFMKSTNPSGFADRQKSTFDVAIAGRHVVLVKPECTDEDFKAGSFVMNTAPKSEAQLSEQARKNGYESLWQPLYKVTHRGPAGCVGIVDLPFDGVKQVTVGQYRDNAFTWRVDLRPAG
ncbi:MAG: hypothetical protein AB7E80_16550 [Hyphomicrobiaceae bacterium]